MEVFLYNSTVCRLCGEENDSGNLLYSSEDNNQSLCDLINTYLPIKVSDDGELPRTICPGCTIQLEATVEFLNLIINGQKVIRELHQREKEYKKSISNDNEPEVITERIVYEINTSDGVYQVEHPIALQVSGLEKPKRKRGRPPKKPKSPEEIAQELAAREKELAAKKQKAAKQVEVSGKRTRKAPTRYQEAVQGKELERIFKEEGVIDEMDGEAEIKKEAEEVEEKPPPKEPEVIGHLEDSGELVVVVKGKGRGRPKGRMRQTHEACTICGMEFNSVGRYMSHVAQHGPVMYQCTACGLTHPTLIEHQTHQKNEGHEGQLVIPCQAQENKPTTTAEEGDVEIQVVPEQDPLNVPDLVIPEEAKSLPTLDETKEEFIKNLVSGESSSNVSDANNDDKPSTSDNPKETTSETEVVELGPKGKPRLKCNQCDKTFNSKQSKSLHIKVHQTSKRKKLTREERLARNKLAQQKRRERIRHDPETHEAWKAKQRERAERRKMEGKVLPMAQLPPEIQKNLRERNKRNSRKFYMKQKLLKVIKAASQEFLKHEDKNEDSNCDSEPELNEK